MSAPTTYPHLNVDETGVVRIDGTRYKVIHLAGEHYQFGWTAEELMRHHPDLRPEQVYVALTYFYDHYDEMVAAMQASLEASERARLAQPALLEKLMQRKKQMGL